MIIIFQIPEKVITSKKENVRKTWINGNFFTVIHHYIFFLSVFTAVFWHVRRSSRLCRTGLVSPGSGNTESSGNTGSGRAMKGSAWCHFLRTLRRCLSVFAVLPELTVPQSGINLCTDPRGSAGRPSQKDCHIFSKTVRKNQKMSKNIDIEHKIWYIINCHPKERMIKNVSIK